MEGDDGKENTKQHKHPFPLNIKSNDIKPNYGTRLDVKLAKPQEVCGATRLPKKNLKRWVEMNVLNDRIDAKVHSCHRKMLVQSHWRGTCQNGSTCQLTKE